MQPVPLKELDEGKHFTYPKPTMFTGVYYHTGRVYPDNMDYFYVHEVGLVNDVFVSSENTDVIPVEETTT